MEKFKLKQEIKILCPNCGEPRDPVDHLYEMASQRGGRYEFGWWGCDTCRHEFKGLVENGEIFIVEVRKQQKQPKLSLLRLRDLFVVVDSYSDYQGKEDWYDYLFHSHQCPTNIMKSILEVYDAEERDPHGLFRFVSALPDNEDNRALLEEAYDLKSLFALFKTEGRDAFTLWPEEDKGVLPFIAFARGYGKKQEVAMASVEARELAAQAWCTEETSGIEMDVRLAEAFADILDKYLPTRSSNLEPQEAKCGFCGYPAVAYRRYSDEGTERGMYCSHCEAFSKN